MRHGVSIGGLQAIRSGWARSTSRWIGAILRFCPGDAATPNKVFIRDPAQPARYFIDLENLVRSGIYNQPRQARFASGDGLWVIASGVA